MLDFNCGEHAVENNSGEQAVGYNCGEPIKLSFQTHVTSRGHLKIKILKFVSLHAESPQGLKALCFTLSLTHLYA